MPIRSDPDSQHWKIECSFNAKRNKRLRGEVGSRYKNVCATTPFCEKGNGSRKNAIEHEQYILKTGSALKASRMNYGKLRIINASELRASLHFVFYFKIFFKNLYVYFRATRENIMKCPAQEAASEKPAMWTKAWTVIAQVTMRKRAKK